VKLLQITLQLEFASAPNRVEIISLEEKTLGEIVPSRENTPLPQRGGGILWVGHQTGNWRKSL
jgi:hypothetical protein